jgi:hypothetical protein
MTDLKLITNDNLHEIVPKYISDYDIKISNYENMIETILRMVRDKYWFNMDRNLLRAFMEDYTYMCCPDDDINKDRITMMFEDSEDEDSDSEDENSNLMDETFKKIMGDPELLKMALQNSNGSKPNLNNIPPELSSLFNNSNVLNNLLNPNQESEAPTPESEAPTHETPVSEAVSETPSTETPSTETPVSDEPTETQTSINSP